MPLAGANQALFRIESRLADWIASDWHVSLAFDVKDRTSAGREPLRR
jgi:hypothetical protein